MEGKGDEGVSSFIVLFIDILVFSKHLFFVAVV